MEKIIINDENTDIYTINKDGRLFLFNEKEYKYKTNEKYMRLEFMRDFSAFRDIDLISKEHKVIVNINASRKQIFFIFLMNDLKNIGVKIISDLLNNEDFKKDFKKIINTFSSDNPMIYSTVEKLLTEN